MILFSFHHFHQTLRPSIFSSKVTFIMSFLSPEQQPALCDFLASPYDERNTETAFIISFSIALVAPAITIFLVAVIVNMKLKERPKPAAQFKCSQEYKVLPVEDSNDRLSSYSKSQYASSPSAQVAGSIGTAAVTAPSLPPMPPIEDEGNPARPDNVNPLLPTRTRKNYIIFAVCSILVIANLIALIVTAFVFQYHMYCDPSGITESDRKIEIMFWFCYAFCLAVTILSVLSWWLMAKLLYYGQAQPGPQQYIQHLVWLTIGPILGLFLRTPLMFIVGVGCIALVMWFGPRWLHLCRRWLRLRGRRRRSELPETGDIKQSI